VPGGVRNPNRGGTGRKKKDRVELHGGAMRGGESQKSSLYLPNVNYSASYLSTEWKQSKAAIKKEKIDKRSLCERGNTIAAKAVGKKLSSTKR